jgi:hypothetical protein
VLLCIELNETKFICLSEGERERERRCGIVKFAFRKLKAFRAV